MVRIVSVCVGTLWVWVSISTLYKQLYNAAAPEWLKYLVVSLTVVFLVDGVVALLCLVVTRNVYLPTLLALPVTVCLTLQFISYSMYVAGLYITSLLHSSF
jgi:hypothetical protein